MLDSHNALDLIGSYDLVCDGSDNFPTRFLVNDACVLKGRPLIYGSVQRFDGQVSVFNRNPDSPNYRDLLPEPPPAGAVPSCSEAGVMGVMPGLIGLLQATEAIKLITGIGDCLDGRLLVVDALRMRFRELTLRPDPSRPPIEQLIDYRQFCRPEAPSMDSISVIDLKALLDSAAPDVQRPEPSGHPACSAQTNAGLQPEHGSDRSLHRFRSEPKGSASRLGLSPRPLQGDCAHQAAQRLGQRCPAKPSDRSR